MAVAPYCLPLSFSCTTTSTLTPPPPTRSPTLLKHPQPTFALSSFRDEAADVVKHTLQSQIMVDKWDEVIVYSDCLDKHNKRAPQVFVFPGPTLILSLTLSHPLHYRYTKSHWSMNTAACILEYYPLTPISSTLSSLISSRRLYSCPMHVLGKVLWTTPEELKILNRWQEALSSTNIYHYMPGQ